MENQTIGRNLFYQRRLKGYTQELLSEKSKIATRTIQRIEKDEVNPQLQTLKLLADSLEIEVDKLIVLENPKEEKLQNKWLLFLHSAPLLGFIFPFSVLFPLFIWLHKKDDNPIYHHHGVKVINFQLSMSILYVLSLISLVTIEMWGFIFFIIVFPFNVIVITFNIFKAVGAKKCFYPLSIPFLKSGIKSQFKNTTQLLFLFAIVTFGCASEEEKSKYDILLEYEGRYEYVGNSTLTLEASEIDTVLYAVIEKAKYPLHYINRDSFANVQNIPITFQRTENGKVKSYTTGGEVFLYLSSDFEKKEVYPRKQLFHNPEEYKYKIPEKTNDRLEVGDLKDAFKNPQPILDMVQETIRNTYSDVHSILIYKDEKLVLEEYFYGFDKDVPHQLRSATKPFIGALVGITMDKGMIRSQHDLLLPYFDNQYDSIANLGQRKMGITIEDFLTYRHGMDCENDNPNSEGNELKMMESKDWVKHTLDLPMVEEPGKTSSYCTGCPLSLASLVEIATGRKIEEFAQENLFTPMGIENYQWRFAPDQSSMATFSQMYITPRDLIKLSKMLKDGGKWQNKQILSQSWVEKTFEMEDGDYGYFWEHKNFVLDGKRYNSYMASGNGGQKINIWPELDMITVFTGGNYNSYAVYGKSTPPNEMIPKYILKALE